jgi:cobalt/nickel transport system permease protein
MQISTMHMPDGFIDAPTSLGAAIVSAMAVAISLKATRGKLDSQAAPMAGLAAVFIFAGQMLNFPVAAGTSGHLLGGVLAATLIGPAAAILAMTVVLSIQALVFADGGLSALGLNILNMGVLTVVVGWLVLIALLKLLPKTPKSVVIASGVAAFISVPASAMGFVIEYAIGGNATFSIGTVSAALFTVHALIGLGEAAITALTISSVLKARKDLVFAARNLLPDQALEIR